MNLKVAARGGLGVSAFFLGYAFKTEFKFKLSARI
jgi:hypothetical protein